VTRSLPFALALALVAGCQDGPTAPPPDATAVDEEAPAAPRLAASAADVATVASAVDDALTRLLPTLPATLGPGLRGGLEAVSHALGARDAAALRAGTARARQELDAARTRGADDAATRLHLDLIGLALERAAALALPGDPGAVADEDASTDPVPST
jgi:hypothetical protein